MKQGCGFRAWGFRARRVSGHEGFGCLPRALSFDSSLSEFSIELSNPNPLVEGTVFSGLERERELPFL